MRRSGRIVPSSLVGSEPAGARPLAWGRPSVGRVRVAALTLLVVASWPATPPDASHGGQPLAGVWHLEHYEGGGSQGPATGLLLITQHHFTLTYTMQPDDGRPTAGRGHAGRYRKDGTELVFDVEHSLEYVGGRGSATNHRSERRPQYSVADDLLTLRFENGAVQRFRRIGR